MFIPKSNSKQKRVKKTQERKNRKSANEHFARRAQILVVASSYLDHSLGEKGHSPGRAKTGSTRELDIFHPKNPNCNFPMPKFDPKSCLIVSKHEKALEIK